MIILTLSTEDLQYLASLLEREDAKISLHHRQGTLPSDVCERLQKKNSGIQAIFEARLVPYICLITDLNSKEEYHLSFQEFNNYFGLPPGLNESQTMQYISDWCSQNNYSVEFKRESKSITHG